MNISTISDISIFVLEWGLTYVLHSTLFFVLAFLLLQIPLFKHTFLKEWVLKLSLIGGLITATIPTVGWIDNALHLGKPEVPSTIVVDPTVTTFLSPTVTEIVEETKIIENENINTAKQTHITTNTSNSMLSTLPWQLWLLVGWLIVGLMIWLYNWKEHRRFLNYLGQRKQVVDEPTLNLVNSILEETNLPASPKITTSERLDSPIVIGKEELCLPEKVIYDLSFEQQETLLAHEIAHILHQDYRWTVIRNWITAFLFFQPLNWITSRLLAAAIEERCDSWSAKITGNYTALAQCLVEVASWMQPIRRSANVTGMALKPSLLKQRIQHLLHQQKNQKDMKHATTKSILGGFILLTMSSLITFSIPNISFAAPDEKEPFELSNSEFFPDLTMVIPTENTQEVTIQQDSVIPKVETETEIRIELPKEVEAEMEIIDKKLEAFTREVEALAEKTSRIIEKEMQGVDNLDELEDKLEQMSENLDDKLDKLDPHIDKIEDRLEEMTEISEIQSEAFIEKIEAKVEALEDVIDAWEDKWEDKIEVIEEEVEEKMEAYEEIVEEAMDDAEDLVDDYELHNNRVIILTSGFEKLEPFQEQILTALEADNYITTKTEFRSIVIDRKGKRLIVNHSHQEGADFEKYSRLLNQRYPNNSDVQYIWVNHK